MSKNKTTPAERLRAARVAAKFKSMGTAAESLGISASTYRAHENGQNEFGPEQAEVYARKFKVSASHLLLGTPDDGDEGDFRDFERIPITKFDQPDTEFQPTDTHPGVSTISPYRGNLPGSSPDIDVSAGAGPGGLPLPASLPHGGVVFSSDAVRGEILLPDYLLSEFTRSIASRIHWIKIRGDSMEPSLLPGERVMVDTTDTSIGQGGIFVLRDPDGEIIVKRLRKAGDGLVELVSDNPKQGVRQVEGNDILVVGRVVGRLARV